MHATRVLTAAAAPVAALASENADSNLAIETAIWPRDQHLQAPVHPGHLAGA